jgi:AcrR family transcriptional regulator
VPRTSDTKQRIQDAARELFAEKGVQRTSLQDIATRLGITKPALYYHFSSREELVRSIVQPFLDEGEAFIRRYEAAGRFDRRELLEEYFDIQYKYRDVLVFVLSELAAWADLVHTIIGWRERLSTLLVGSRPSLARAARAAMVLGGLQDCTVQLSDAPPAKLRRAAVDAACTTLGIG